MKFLIALLGLLVVFGLAFIASNGKKKIRYRPLVVMVVLQVILAYALLNTEVGTWLIGGFASVFKSLLDYANEGIAFVFGDLTTVGADTVGTPFFLSVLMPIVVISALIGILQYIRILPFVINILVWY